LLHVCKGMSVKNLCVEIFSQQVPTAEFARSGGLTG